VNTPLVIALLVGLVGIILLFLIYVASAESRIFDLQTENEQMRGEIARGWHRLAGEDLLDSATVQRRLLQLQAFRRRNTPTLTRLPTWQEPTRPALQIVKPSRVPAMH
jgi:hypothetical protein